ncbi:hypothetical protein OGAPHI_006337 [Ogataea philodendri]|uniref:Enoyl reductase (ER) domain-containing protein n=1 Tax=Ogataea philodendri TaxID=1378263 RepID=A0A9P8T124_9ASCO|nr:uncharacterized protein OGAPHI_006337 [Ogataea philodendri]KAH3661490.1 hypothetical protein OGAPHI_006337 [Ogataea philodendri]
MSTYKALVCHKYGEPLKIEQVPLPEPVSGCAVVKVISSAVFKRVKELITFEHPVFSTPLPFVPGGYGVGRVVSVGPGGHLKTGQLVYLDSLVTSRESPQEMIIKGGFGGISAESKELSKLRYKRDGYLQEYALVDIDDCYPIDESALGEHSVHYVNNIGPFLVPYAGFRAANLKAGETVIISPATGKFSGAAVAVASALGAKVVAVGRNKAVLERYTKTLPNVSAVTLTGDKAADSAALAHFGPADVFLDLNPVGVPKNPNFDVCFQALGYGGRALLQGFSTEPLSIDYSSMAFKNISIVSKAMYTRAEAQDLVKLFNSKSLRYWEIFRTQVFGIDEFEAAFAAADTATSWDDLVVIEFNKELDVLGSLLFDLFKAGDTVDFFRRTKQLEVSVPQSVADVKHEDDRDGDVGSKEVADVEVEENAVSVGEGNEREEDQTGPCSNHLKRWSEGDSVVKTMVGDGLSETDIGDRHKDPRDESRHGGDVGQPGEHDRRGVGAVQVDHQGNDTGQNDSHVRHTVLGATSKDRRHLALESHGVQSSGGGVKERVSTGVGGREDTGVDNMVQHLDSGVLDSNNVWRSSSSGSTLIDGIHQTVAIGRHHDSNNENTKNVEDGQSENETSAGFWQVMSWGLGLSRTTGDQFWRQNKGESTFHNSCPAG